MNQWNNVDNGGQGGFYAGDVSSSKSKPTARTQFLSSASIRQVLEAPEEGLSFGDSITTMVRVIGIVMEVKISTTKIVFTLSDDTGAVDCTDWLETDEEEKYQKKEMPVEGIYYEVFGSIKSPQGQRHIIVFKLEPIENYNNVVAHMCEILAVSRKARKENTVKDVEMTPAMSYKPSYAPKDSSNLNYPADVIEVLNIIKANKSEIGWDRKDPYVAKKFSKARLDEIASILIGEGLVYNTIDEQHFCGTSN